MHGEHRERGPPAGRVVGEVEEPAVVRAVARGPQLVFRGFAEASERNAAVGEQHFGDDPFAFEHLGAQRGVPLAVAPVGRLGGERRRAFLGEERTILGGGLRALLARRRSARMKSSYCARYAGSMYGT